MRVLFGDELLDIDIWRSKMEILNREKFLNKKNSDTLIIYGSGSSINNLTKGDITKLAQFDSVGFN